MTNLLQNHFFDLSTLTFCVGITLVLAIIGKFFPEIPEPQLRFKSPFGKLPFFDGVILYGLFILILLVLVDKMFF